MMSLVKVLLLVALLGGVNAIPAKLRFMSLQGKPGGLERRAISDVEWKVTFIGSRVEDGNTWFTYAVTARAEGGDKDLSHYVLGVPDCVTVLKVDIDGKAVNVPGLSVDPTTKLFGLKDDVQLNSGSTRVISILVAGTVAETLISYSVKGGTYFAVGEVRGPSCDAAPTLPPLPPTDAPTTPVVPEATQPPLPPTDTPTNPWVPEATQPPLPPTDTPTNPWVPEATQPPAPPTQAPTPVPVNPWVPEATQAPPTPPPLPPTQAPTPPPQPPTDAPTIPWVPVATKPPLPPTQAPTTPYVL